MSIDLYLQIDTGDPEGLVTVVEVGNYTNNCQPMWRKALAASTPKHPELAALFKDSKPNLCEMTGKNAGEMAILLADAVADMDDPTNWNDYIALNPTNGWGNFGGATEYLRHFTKACQTHPKCTIYASC